MERVRFKDGGGVEMAYLGRRVWAEYNYPLLNENEILIHLVKFINSHHFETRKNEIDNAWTLILQEAKNLPSGSLRDGAVKEVTAIIDNFKNEIIISKPTKDELRLIANRLHTFINTNTSEVGAYEAKHIILSFLNHNPKIRCYWLDNEREAMKMAATEIFSHLLFTLRLLRQQKQGRFLEVDTKPKTKSSLLNKQSRIKTINETLEIAKIYNNHHLIQECKTMIEQIEKEDLIRERTILKSSFWQIHRLLIASEFTGLRNTAFKPLYFDSKNKINDNSATATANYLIKIVMGKETSFTPKKSTVSKKFFENGYKEERELIQYK